MNNFITLKRSCQYWKPFTDKKNCGKMCILRDFSRSFSFDKQLNHKRGALGVWVLNFLCVFFTFTLSIKIISKNKNNTYLYIYILPRLLESIQPDPCIIIHNLRVVALVRCMIIAGQIFHLTQPFFYCHQICSLTFGADGLCKMEK